jgi:hypothetical protein
LAVAPPGCGGHFFDRAWIKRRPAQHAAGSLIMGVPRYTTGVTRADLTRDCLRELHLWPGCETVEGLAVLGEERGKFTVHVAGYGLAKKKKADRALRCIQREKLRHFHLKVE